MNDNIDTFTNWLVPPDPKGLRAILRSLLGVITAIVFVNVVLFGFLVIGTLTI